MGLDVIEEGLKRKRHEREEMAVQAEQGQASFASRVGSRIPVLVFAAAGVAWALL
jgi:hypothetical protein